MTIGCGGCAQLQMDDVTVVGADEMSIRKGHNYLTVFCDLVQRRVLFATPGKDAEVWYHFAQELLKHNGQPHGLTQVSIDMSPAYINGVQENCRNAEIVFDKFHVVAHVSDAVDEVRKLESKSSTAAKDQLKDTLWLWRKNPENLTTAQAERMQRIDHRHLYTAKAYQMRLALQEIYQMPQDLAKKRLPIWLRWVRTQAKKAPKQILNPMLKAAEMIQRHLQGIYAHWAEFVTNAFLEALNSVFSATKRKARGYRTTKNLIAMLYFTAAKLNIPSFKPTPFV